MTRFAQDPVDEPNPWVESGDKPETISPWVTLPTQALFGHTLTEDDLSL